MFEALYSDFLSTQILFEWNDHDTLPLFLFARTTGANKQHCKMARGKFLLIIENHYVALIPGPFFHFSSSKARDKYGQHENTKPGKGEP